VVAKNVARPPSAHEPVAFDSPSTSLAMMRTLLSIPRPLLILLLFAAPHIRANPATLTPKDCFSGNAVQKLNISTVYAQILDNDQMGTYLNLTVLGTSSQQILGLSNASTSLGELYPRVVDLLY
jgi:hypothetical protein